MHAHGKGTRFYPDGCFKTGDWIESKMHGRGKFSFESGVYTGEFEEDKMHGKGKLKFADGSVYTGNFDSNQMHGQGVFQS